MELLQTIIDGILNLGAAVFVPILMIIIGLIARMKLKDAVSSGITLGVAFTGMGLVIGFMIEALMPAAQGLAERTGIVLTIIDGGWTSMSTLSWAWPYAFLMFPLQLAINGVMLAFNITKTLNVDLWNVWGKIFTAVLIIGVTGNVPLAFVGAGIQIIVELIICDTNQPAVEELTGIPGVTVSHGMMIINVILYPIDLLLRQIPALNRDFDAAVLKSKIGVLGENHVMGFIIGLLLGLAAGYTPGASAILGVQAATAMTLFPMVSKLFMQALSPISDSLGEFMKKRFKNREIFIGLDWPILGGSSEIWVVSILLVPIALLYAFILPNNGILPFAGIINLGLVAPALVVCGGNLIRMLLVSTLATPLFLWVATYIAPTVTELARTTGAVALNEGERFSWSSVEFPIFRLMLMQLSRFTVFGVVLLVGWLVLFVFYVMGMKQRYARQSVDA